MIRRLIYGWALVLAAISGAARAQNAGPTASPSAMQGPESVRLAIARTAQLTLEHSPQTALEWRTNVGQVQNIDDVHLEYVAPNEHFPQVAIIGAWDEASHAPIVHLIQLIGAPSIEVKSEPNVSVEVHILGTSFGPVRTNAAGVALVPVEVPPGVDTATTLATDSHGNVTKSELPLKPPPFPRVLTICAPTESAVYVVEVTQEGQPAKTPTFGIRAEAALTSAPEIVGPGLFRVQVSPRVPLTQPLRAEIRATENEFTSACSIVLSPPPVALPYTLDGNVVPIEPEYSWLVGGNLGWLTNGNRISGPWVSLRGARTFSQRHDGFRVELEAAYTTTSTTLSTTDGQQVDLDVKTWPVFASLRYVMAWGVVHPSASLGAGATFTQASASGGNILSDETFATPWLGGSIGALWWQGRHELGAELGYSSAQHSGGAIVGNVAGARVVVNYLYAL